MRRHLSIAGGPALKPVFFPMIHTSAKRTAQPLKRNPGTFLGEGIMLPPVLVWFWVGLGGVCWLGLSLFGLGLVCWFGWV